MRFRGISPPYERMVGSRSAASRGRSPAVSVQCGEGGEATLLSGFLLAGVWH